MVSCQVANITFDGLMLSTGTSGLSYIPDDPPRPGCLGSPGRAEAIDGFFLGLHAKCQISYFDSMLHLSEHLDAFLSLTLRHAQRGWSWQQYIYRPLE